MRFLKLKLGKLRASTSTRVCLRSRLGSASTARIRARFYQPYGRAASKWHKEIRSKKLCRLRVRPGQESAELGPIEGNFSPRRDAERVAECHISAQECAFRVHWLFHPQEWFFLRMNEASIYFNLFGRLSLSQRRCFSKCLRSTLLKRDSSIPIRVK